MFYTRVLSICEDLDKSKSVLLVGILEGDSIARYMFLYPPYSMSHTVWTMILWVRFTFDKNHKVEHWMKMNSFQSTAVSQITVV